MYFHSVVRKEPLPKLLSWGNVLLGRASPLDSFYRHRHKCFRPVALGYRDFIYNTRCLYSSTVKSRYWKDQRIGGEIESNGDRADSYASYRCSIYSSSLAFFVRSINPIDGFYSMSTGLIVTEIRPIYSSPEEATIW